MAEASDAETVWSILSQANTLEWITPHAAEITRSNLFHKLGWDADQTARIFMVDADDRPVGVEVIGSIDWINRSAMIPCIAVEDHGKQYGVDATQTLVRYAYDALGLHRVSYTSIHPQARKRADTLGAKFEGTDRQAVWKNGQWLDRNRFAFLKEE